MNFETMVERYQRLIELKTERENEIKRINETADILKSKLLEVFAEKGIDSIKTPIGTIYKSSRASASIADWDVFFNHVQKHELWHLIEHRCSAKKAEEYVQEHDVPPPGVNYSRTVTLNIRRS